MSATTGYRYRSLTPEQEDAIRAARRSGVHYLDLAGEYGVSERTIFRVCETAAYDTVTVTIGGWTARHRLETDGPVRIEPWRPS